MTNLTLAGWKSTVATGIVESVPLQDFNSALTLTEDYLSAVGGWVPDDVGEPVGPGIPANGVTTAEAIELIEERQKNRIYQSDITGTMNFRVVLNAKLALGLSDNDVITQIEPILDQIVADNLQTTQLEFIDITTYSGTVTNGPTTASERVNIQSVITGGGQIINPKVLGLNAARATYNLDNTYNVEYLFTESGKPLFLMIRKYTNTTYTALDPGASKKYGITMNATSYRITGGTVLTV